jgi:hypothetical protein
MRTLALVLSLSLPACGAATHASHAGASPSPTAAVLPTPYTAEQIRDASHVGRTYVFRVERAGQLATLHSITFTSVTPDAAELRTETRDEHGAITEGPTVSHAAWDELRRHAEFPRDATTVSHESITVPVGTFECTVYVVRGEGGEVSHFYFARERPGPPVMFYVERGGVRVVTNTLVEYREGAN